MFFDIDSIKEIGSTLARNKTRTLLTAFGIFWGTVMLTLLMGGGRGLKGMLNSNFAGFATNSAILFPDRTTMPYKGYAKGMTWSLRQADVDLMRRSIPEIETFSPIAGNSTRVNYRSKSKAVQIQGVEDNFMQVLSPVITDGRFINASDVANSRKVCVIGVEVASELFPGISPVGKFVEADGVYYRVVGVARQRSKVSIGGRVDESICVPLSTMRRAYNMGDKLGYIMMIAADGASPGALKPRIMHALQQNHPLHPDDEQAVGFMDISDSFKMVDNVMTGVDILLLFVGFSSLFAGVIGVGNIMWIVVKERTHEFGVRRAIGAKPRSILSQILAESALLTVVAGVAGVCFSVGVLYLVQTMANSGDVEGDFMISFSSAMVILVLFIVLGSAAGTFPAIKAMRIKPIEALSS